MKSLTARTLKADSKLLHLALSDASCARRTSGNAAIETLQLKHQWDTNEVPLTNHYWASHYCVSYLVMNVSWSTILSLKYYLTKYHIHSYSYYHVISLVRAGAEAATLSSRDPDFWSVQKLQTCSDLSDLSTPGSWTFKPALKLGALHVLWDPKQQCLAVRYNPKIPKAWLHTLLASSLRLA